MRRYFKLADVILEAIVFIKDTKICHGLTFPHLPQVVISPPPSQPPKYVPMLPSDSQTSLFIGILVMIAI
jgi:hypothetical protein